MISILRWFLGTLSFYPNPLISIIKKILGVDIGATKTRYALADGTGRIIEVLSDQGASHEFYGQEAAGKNLEEVLHRIAKKSKQSLEDLAFVYLGATGADTPEDFDQLREL